MNFATAFWEEHKKQIPSVQKLVSIRVVHPNVDVRDWSKPIDLKDTTVVLETKEVNIAFNSDEITYSILVKPENTMSVDYEFLRSAYPSMINIYRNFAIVVSLTYGENTWLRSSTPIFIFEDTKFNIQGILS